MADVFGTGTGTVLKERDIIACEGDNGTTGKEKTDDDDEKKKEDKKEK